VADADFMMRDPFERPVEVSGGGLEAMLETVLARLGIDGKDRIILFMTPADVPRTVLGARADWTCHACACAVWVSQSSRTVENPIVVCMRCLARALEPGT
jgi:hypothetical protein